MTVTVGGTTGTDLSVDVRRDADVQHVELEHGAERDGGGRPRTPTAPRTAVTLTHTATGGDYGSVTRSLSVTITDDDAGLVLSESALSVTEGSNKPATR